MMRSGLNRLSKQNLDNMLRDKKSVLAIWYTKDCSKCGDELWDIYYSVFAFGAYKNVVSISTPYA